MSHAFHRNSLRERLPQFRLMSWGQAFLGTLQHRRIDQTRVYRIHSNPELRKIIRGKDWAARLGGDEFGFLYLGDIYEAASTGQSICELISRPYRIGDLQVSVGASCGIAIYPEAGRSAHVLFDRSDYALYNSKSNSRGRTTIY